MNNGTFVWELFIFIIIYWSLYKIHDRPEREPAVVMFGCGTPRQARHMHSDLVASHEASLQKETDYN